MMKKRMMRYGITAILAGLTVWAAAMTAYAGAGTWVQDGTGWRWRTVQGNYPANQWLWIDGNNDGIAESYYFDGNGYLLTGTTTPDGYTVDASGAWTENGVVRARGVLPDIDEVGYVNPASGDAASGTEQGNAGQTAQPIMNGSQVEQIVMNEELIGLIHEEHSLPKITNKTETESRTGEKAYIIPYRGYDLQLETRYKDETAVDTILGRVDQIFDFFPDEGMELNAFFDNTGFDQYGATGKKLQASTGNSDYLFGLPAGSYRMCNGSNEHEFFGGITYNTHHASFSILLTQGDDGNWYIYKDSRVIMRR